MTVSNSKVRGLLLALFAVLFLSVSASAQNKITASITFTNKTTNGMVFTLNGDTRTFTNQVFNTANQILTNADTTGCGSKTNFYVQVAGNPFAQVQEIDTGSNSVNLVGNANLNMTLTFTAGYCTVTYSTNSVVPMIALLGPVSSLPTAQARTNVSSYIVAALNQVEDTNVINPNGLPVSSLISKSNLQQWIPASLMLTNTNGIFSGEVSNSLAISGNLANTTNGVNRGGIFINPSLTNGVNYGAAFSSANPTFSAAEQFGAGASAGGNSSTALGALASALSSGLAVGNGATAAVSAVAAGASAVAIQGATAIGSGATGGGTNSTVIGLSASAPTNNATALGYGATAGQTNSTAIGTGATTTAPNQVMLGGTAATTVTGSNLVVGGNATITAGLNVGGAITNATFAGPANYPANSDVAYARLAITTLANGVNADLPVGTNVFIEVSGPTAPFSINGIANGRDGKVVRILNQTGFPLTYANESGSDATTANRIRTTTGGDIGTPANSLNEFVYSAAASRWILAGAPAVSTGIQSLVLSNTPVPTVIGNVGYIPATLTTNSFLVLDQWIQITNPVNHSVVFSNFITGSNVFTVYSNGAVAFANGVTNTGAGFIGNGFGLTNLNSQVTGVDSNAIIYCQSNGFADGTALGDLSGMFNDLEADPNVWSSFVDGIAFAPRFGTNTSLMGRTVTGGRNIYTPDGYGAVLTNNGISLTLPNALSNVTVVVNYEGVPVGSSPTPGATVFSLGNPATGSDIEVSDNGDGIIQAWEDYHLNFYNGRSNPNYTNLVQPLWMANYSYLMMGAQIIEPRIIAFQRDSSANWRVYVDTVQSKMGLNTPQLVFQCPTNATADGIGLNTLYLGYSGVTNTTYPQATNYIVASAFVFATTNVSAVVAAYKAALWLQNTDTMDIWLGDSLLAASDTPFPSASYPSWFYRHRFPQRWIRNYAQGGSHYSDMQNVWNANGGIALFTNAPAKYKKNLIVGFGINDIYGNGTGPSALFTIATNSLWPYINAGVNVKFVDVAQIATNASTPEAPYTYSLQSETNAWQFDMMVRTNMTFPISEYIPRRDFCSQTFLNTNGQFSLDGVHLFGRSNSLYNKALSDLIASPEPVGPITNGPIGPTGLASTQIDQWLIQTNPANQSLVFTNTATKAFASLGTNGYFTNGFVVINSNAAPIGTISNLTITSGTSFTNNLQTRVQLIGIIQLTCGQASAGTAQAGATYNSTIGGASVQESFAASTTAIATNAVQEEIFDILGPGDYFNLTSSDSGSGSTTAYQQFHFKAF